MTRRLSGLRSNALWLPAIAASAGAGLIHLAHGPAHVEELGPLGAGFYGSTDGHFDQAGPRSRVVMP